MKGTQASSTRRLASPARPPDAALGRAMRGLVGPSTSRPGWRTAAGVGRARRDRGARLRRTLGIVTPARAAGLLGMLAAGFLFTLVTGPTAFGLSRTDVPELSLDRPVGDRRRARAARGRQRLPARHRPARSGARDPAGRRLGATSRSPCPTRAVVVAITERTAILAWEVGNRRYIADGVGDDLRGGRGRRGAARRRRRRRMTSGRRPSARSRSAATSTRSTSTSRRGSAASRPADIGSTATALRVDGHRSSTGIVRRARPAAGTRSSASTARRPGRPR